MRHSGWVPTLADQFRQHFGHREHLYGVLLDHLADDLDAGGVTALICRDVVGTASRGDAVQLRLLAGLFRIVLRGEAPPLAAFYPSLGGAAPADGVWPVAEPVLLAHVEELRAALAIPPQTNEVGRSAMLAVGLFAAVRVSGIRRVRLLEPGASAGLNLNVDRYRITGPGWAWGSPSSPLVLDTQAADAGPVDLEIVERRGCDLDPVAASTPEGARYLTSFVWPFDLARHERLAAALDIGRAHPVAVDLAGASAWLASQLAQPRGDVLTVVWQSITEQYWPAAESAAVRDVVASARARMPLAHLSMEGVPPRQTGGGYDISTHGPELRLDGRLIARSHHHGPPVLLLPEPRAVGGSKGHLG